MTITYSSNQMVEHWCWPNTDTALGRQKRSAREPCHAQPFAWISTWQFDVSVTVWQVRRFHNSHLNDCGDAINAMMHDPVGLQHPEGEHAARDDMAEDQNTCQGHQGVPESKNETTTRGVLGEGCRWCRRLSRVHPSNGIKLPHAKEDFRKWTSQQC